MSDLHEKTPLADRIRPKSFTGFFGQDKIIGKNSLLRRAIESDKLPSMIFWGPPGSGKTTLAYIIAQQTKSEFIEISAVNSGLKDLREIIKQANENKQVAKSTILFIDEIHRWNKKQQDSLLPEVERGIIILIGATTENPSFEVCSPLLSRCRVFVFERLKQEHIVKIIKNAIKNKQTGFGKLKIKIALKTIKILADMSNGDARTSLNVLEYAIFSFKSSKSSRLIEITLDLIKQAFQKTHLFYDKDGEEHYNIISALHKSMRGGDANASLYWLARMLEAGENPLYIARRIVRFASEDIGLRNSRALEQAVAAYNACHFIGLPECNVILAQAVVYMSKCSKSNDLYMAYRQAVEDVQKYGSLPVPLHIRNAPTKLMKKHGYGQGYKYSPDYDYKEEQEYLPKQLKSRKYLK
ncbi:replication-associated recombination protein A [Patescibacteria group bacterium]|nr:replication-associated recombination protein A [Patescibacteria group bacterium]